MASSSQFLEVPGEVAALMRTFDWSASPLDEPASWQPALRTVVSFMLSSKFPMFLAWGEELACLYNDAYAEILGRKHPAALGKRFEEIWPEVWGDIYPLVQRALSGDSVFQENLPLVMQRKGFEEQTWFTFSYSPVRDEQGEIRGMCVTCIETTGHVLAARERVEENKRLHELFQQAPGIMAVVREPDHVFELVNHAYLQLVGHRDLVGKPVREALPELEGQGLFELLDEVYRTGKPFVGRGIPVRLQRVKDGDLEERFVDFVYQPIRDATGRVTGVFAEGSDVTEAVRATQALRESEERLRQLANTIPHLAWIAEADGHVRWYNERWYEFSGFMPGEGHGWEELVMPEELPAVLDKWQTSLRTGAPYEVSVRLRAASGEYRVFFVRAAPLRDANGRIVQWFGTNTDVTDIQKAQEELQAANRRKDEFLAMLAHELRNPLAPINTAAELLKLPRLDKEHVRNAGEIIIRQVNHMTELVDDLLDVSRVTRGLINLEEEPLALEPVVADAIEQVQPLINAKNHQLHVHAPDATVLVCGDRTRLTQVFANIINNAAKYTPDRGRISVSIEPEDGWVAVVVRDNGIGIDSELLPRIFDLFSQGVRSPDRSQGGLGLGLALVKSLVELQHGTVTAYSDGLGQGSVFTVRLPRVATKPAQDLPEAAVDRPGTGVARSARILVVDDNADAAEMVAMLLQTFGHEVLVEHSARQAIERARDAKPEILFLDIGLPDMDGYELARRLRALPETAAATFVALTGYGQKEDKARAFEEGFDHYMVKPVAIEELLKLVDQASQNRA